MAMARNSNSESSILATVHESAAGLHGAGLVDKAAMRQFDELCLTPVVSLAPDEIRALREARRLAATWSE